MRSSYREGLRCLLEGVQWLPDPSAKVRVAGKSGISQALSRLGAEPIQRLCQAVLAPIKPKDVVDTAENEEAFGRSGARRGATAFPEIRFVALLENGTPVLGAACLDRDSVDDLILAEAVMPALSPRG